MQLQGKVTIPATPEQVWQGLNDPEVLRKCIPGCEEVRQISESEMHARVMLKLGPVRANFVGKVLLADVRPLVGCTLNFEGSGGSAGFAKGSSVIALTPVALGTQVDYTAQASVAGKLGQIGGRLMDASARHMADRFFAAFKDEVSPAADGDFADPAAPRLEPAEMAADISPIVTSGTAQATSTYASTQPQAGMARAARGATPEHWFDRQKPYLLWFAAGVSATALGVWMGAHWLR
jgi:uncharacterized protein